LSSLSHIAGNITKHFHTNLFSYSRNLSKTTSIKSADHGLRWRIQIRLSLRVILLGTTHSQWCKSSHVPENWKMVKTST